MKIMQSGDYRIYIDDVRMDPYIKSWNTTCGLNASDAAASITMYRTEALEQWKAYLAQVRVFVQNPFTGKFSIVFEGEITNRSFGEMRGNIGEITFRCQGFYHWLQVPIPLMIGSEEAINDFSRFKYEAYNINVEEASKFLTTEADMKMKNKNIREIIDILLKNINAGYYLNEDSTYTWAKLDERFKVMGEVLKAFRDSGFLDAVTFTRTTRIESFYVYLNQILTQLMFEFYQDIDGSFRIKPPSWSDNILNTHIFDESIIERVTGFNDWANEPTRVLVIGGDQDIDRRRDTSGYGDTLKVPMGLYVGKPGDGEYYTQTFEFLAKKYGMDEPIGGSGTFFDDLTDNYTVTSPYGMRGNDMHEGTDYGLTTGVPVHSVGVAGVVKLAEANNSSAGNWVIVEENISGKHYEFVYMHLSKIKVSTGNQIEPGGLVGLAGNTGESRGAHLHFEVWDGVRRGSSSTSLDPEKFLDKMKTMNPSSAPGTGAVADFMNQDLKRVDRGKSADEWNDWINKQVKKGGSASDSVMYDQGKSFLDASQMSGLDILYLIAHAAHETAWGRSNIVKDKANFFGIGAFDNSAYESSLDFGNYAQGIVDGAVWIRENFYDNGQKTLYQMRHSKNGKHDYATDPGWANKIAETMSNAPSIRAGSSASGGSSSPGAMTGGMSFLGGWGSITNTTPSLSDMGYIDFLNGEGNNDKKTVKKKAKAIMYNSFEPLLYFFGPKAKYFKSIIRGAPGGVNPNLTACAIENMSDWDSRFNTEAFIGIMGVPKEYAGSSGLSENQLLDPSENIHEGAKLLQNALDMFGNKPTFALGAYYMGDLSKMADKIEEAGVEDFSKVREYLSPAVVYFVDQTIEQFCQLHDADYIKGDPHEAIYVEGNFSPEDLAENTDVKNYESNYKPTMSDEERKYKVNLKISEQLLIRYDASIGDTSMNADELIKRYAEYMAQLHRAESHGVDVQFSTSMPGVRPGFNAWLEPTRRDAVFYVTKVTHNGSFQRGCRSTASGGFVRNSKDYDDIESNIFIGKTHASASEFGSVIKKSEMDGMRNKLKKMHRNDNVVSDAKRAPTLSKIYSNTGGKDTKYSTNWSGEFTANQLKNKIDELYKKAPNVVKDRSKKLQKIVDQSADTWTDILLQQKF